jgi:hypothetical protein
VRILSLCVLALIAAQAVQAAPVDDATALAMAKPQEMIVAPDITLAERTALLTPVEAFYGFWENGSQTLLDKALSPRGIVARALFKLSVEVACGRRRPLERARRGRR